MAMFDELTAPTASCALVIVPFTIELPLIGPVTLMAVIEYGVAVSF